MYFPQMPELADLAKAIPDLTIILNHIGGLLRVGLRQPGQRSDGHLAQDMAPLINYCIEQFGPDRCMFESNFPVDKVSFSYHVMYKAFKRLSRGYSATERADMFHDTAARVYRLDL